MIVLSYGFQQPENGDPGSIWFPALNADIQKMNDHTHNGINSAPISFADLAGGEVTIPSGSWVLDVAGRYKQAVATPAGFDMDNFNVQVRITGGDIIYPSMTRLTGTSFEIYTLDNTLDLTAVFR